ncbi:hypothetical protein [Cesiribacter sp. SM1]|uniref:hypothetical protein n=1 Tax=Cesiribacter sp. SM1 TaxID=2861196 RepID=UPI001CD527D3|nr:hypothetical protein [Cesiribacter sp. SM1]
MEVNRMPDNNKHPKNADVDNRADLNGKKGKFETEDLEKTDVSAIPGAELNKDVGDAAAGAGLGGNQGRGTRSRKDLS